MWKQRFREKTLNETFCVFKCVALFFINIYAAAVQMFKLNQQTRKMFLLPFTTDFVLTSIFGGTFNELSLFRRCLENFNEVTKERAVHRRWVPEMVNIDVWLGTRSHGRIAGVPYFLPRTRRTSNCIKLHTSRISAPRVPMRKIIAPALLPYWNGRVLRDFSRLSLRQTKDHMRTKEIILVANRCLLDVFFLPSTPHRRTSCTCIPIHCPFFVRSSLEKKEILLSLYANNCVKNKRLNLSKLNETLVNAHFLGLIIWIYRK